MTGIPTQHPFNLDIKRIQSVPLILQQKEGLNIAPALRYGRPYYIVSTPGVFRLATRPLLGEYPFSL